MRKKRNYLIHHYLLNKSYASTYFTANLYYKRFNTFEKSISPIYSIIYLYFLLLYYYLYIIYFILFLHYYFTFIIILYYFIFYIIILYYYLYYYHIYLFPVLKIISLLKSHR